MNKEQATLAVLNALTQFNQIHRPDRPVPVCPDTRLFGQGGQLDSLDLVRFVFLVEEEVQQKAGKSVALTDEKAMSQRSSPFASVGSLADYISTLVSQHS